MSGADIAHFDILPDGTEVQAVTLKAGTASATILDYGARLQALWIPDRHGDLADVTLGFGSIANYLNDSNYFGSSVGRYANRIAGGRFVLDGEQQQVAVNRPPNCLHGGDGFDARIWRIESATGDAVTMSLVSPHDDQGYPGELTATVTYRLTGGTLTVDYTAETDRPTIVNLTCHPYFNLAGEGAGRGALGHLLTIPAEHYTPVDAVQIPTGELRPVVGTAFDFREPRRVDDGVREVGDPQLSVGRGYDHNFAIGLAIFEEPVLVARLADPVSGRAVEIFSDQPGLQLYSGNFLDGTLVGKSGRVYRQGDGIVLEPQLFPDTPNHPHFGSARLAPGEVYRHQIIYRLLADAPEDY